jgi:putative membrane protein
MLPYTIFRTLHFLAILALAIALLIENIAIKPSIGVEDARNLAKVDAVYTVSIVLAFLFGLTLWLWIGKPSAFYSANALYWSKIGIFSVLAILSLIPKRFFKKSRNTSEEEITVPKIVILVLRTQLSLLATIPLLAFLVARGISL